MGRLRTGYLITGMVTGMALLFGFVTSLPDGALHIVFCDVGQGDAAYVRFADGRDMLVDGGPNDRVLDCLGRHMPFWDKTIDLVVLTHPQKDHLVGLVSVVERYRVRYFIKSGVENDTASYTKLKDLLSTKNIPVKIVDRGQTITVGSTSLLTVWPSWPVVAQITRVQKLSKRAVKQSQRVLGQTTDANAHMNVNLNDASVVLHLTYGDFDALLTGDADSRVQGDMMRSGDMVSPSLAVGPIEVLKVPHHGSKTAMTLDFLDALKPQLAVISVGRNSYGHPHEETLAALAERAIRVLRTDLIGDIHIVSDGKGWSVHF